MLILAIETSCDDTGVALLDIEKGGPPGDEVRPTGDKLKVVADFVSSQTQIHAPFGGVVPNLAVRAHYKNLPILLEKAFSKIDPRKVDLIAVTIGPGLEPSLWAGVNTARVLALVMKKPIVGVNHLEGHIAANFLSPVIARICQQAETKQSRGTTTGLLRYARNDEKIFPAICLIVSGGHTQLVLIKDIGKYKVIGQTRDDAAGEAFDKVAKLLGLGYPGGPEIALRAKNGRSGAFDLPRPMIDAPNYDFSFSGLKTAVLYLVRDLGVSAARQHLPGDLNLPTKLSLVNGQLSWPTRQVAKILSPRAIEDICASFQQAVIDVLVHKTIRAAVEYKAKAVMLSGGVAANDLLRKNLKLTLACEELVPTYNLSAKGGSASGGKLNFLAPAKKFCTDNAVMIGLAGYWKYKRDGGDRLGSITAKANLNL